MAKIIVASYLILSCALFLYHSNIKAEANGRITNYQTQTIDAYTIKLGTIPPSPQIGKTHFSIQIIDSDTENPVYDLPQKAYISTIDPSVYEFNHKFEVPGNWQIKVLINDQNSQNNAVFELFVKQFSPLPGILTLIFLIILLSTFAYIIRIKLNQKRISN